MEAEDSLATSGREGVWDQEVIGMASHLSRERIKAIMDATVTWNHCQLCGNYPSTGVRPCSTCKKMVCALCRRLRFTSRNDHPAMTTYCVEHDPYKD